MTDEIRRVRDEHVMAAIAVALTAGLTIEHRSHTRIEPVPAGFVVKAAGDFVVDEHFDDVRSAVGYFLDLCDGLSSHVI